MLENDKQKPLVNMTLTDFANETSSESPAPGGGSISAYCGAMGVALGTMVANLSAHKRGWDDRWEEFSDWAEKGIEYQNTLLSLVDEDTNAFNKIMDAFEQFSTARAQVSASSRTARENEAAAQDILLTLEEDISDIREADLASLLTQLEFLMTNKEAAQATFTRITSKSLFDFLG